MRLARTLTLALLASFAAVFGVQAWFSAATFASTYESDLVRDHRVMGRALAAAIAAGWRSMGAGTARDMIEEANERESEIRIRWVQPGATSGEPDAPSVGPERLGALAGGHDAVVLAPEAGPRGTIYTYTPVVVRGKPVGAVELAQSLAGESRFIRTRLVHEAAATAILVLVCGAVAWVLGVRFVGEPVRQLVDQARRVGAGDLSLRLRPRGGDELSMLANEMNAMTDRLAEARERLHAEGAARLAAVEQLQHADRLSTIGQLASGIAHELGTPLNIVSGHAEMIASGELSSAAEVRTNARVIQDQTRRMVRIVQQLLDFARRKTAERSTTDLVALARGTLSLLAPLAEKHGVALELPQDEEPRTAKVDAAQIEQVLTNLVMNAVQASPEGGRVEVQVVGRQIGAPPGRDAPPCASVCIEVRDHGHGIDEEARRRLFDPFFTTKGVGEGTGLGLSVAYGIVADHGGWIEVQSAPGAGSRFTVWLPQPEPA